MKGRLPGDIDEILTKKSVDFSGNGQLFTNNEMDGWTTCDFTSFLKVFQSYQDDVWMIMKGCVQWNSAKQ